MNVLVDKKSRLESQINCVFNTNHVHLLFIHQIKFTGLTFIVLPHLKCVDFIFGLPALKTLHMSIQSSNNLVVINDRPFPCESQPQRISCLLVDSSKVQKILTKASRNKRNECELVLVSLHFNEELKSMKTDFGPELHT